MDQLVTLSLSKPSKRRFNNAEICEIEKKPSFIQNFSTLKLSELSSNCEKIKAKQSGISPECLNFKGQLTELAENCEKIQTKQTELDKNISISKLTKKQAQLVQNCEKIKAKQMKLYKSVSISKQKNEFSEIFIKLFSSKKTLLVE
jgi:hypothetical protein